MIWMLFVIGVLAVFGILAWFGHKNQGALAAHPLNRKKLIARYSRIPVACHSWDADRSTPVGVVFLAYARDKAIPVYVTREVYETIEKAFVKDAYKTVKELLG